MWRGACVVDALLTSIRRQARRPTPPKTQTNRRRTRAHWEKRHAHIDSRVEHLEWPGVWRQKLNATVRRHRGLLSRSMSSEVVFERLVIQLAEHKGGLFSVEMLVLESATLRVLQRNWRRVRGPQRHSKR